MDSTRGQRAGLPLLTRTLFTSRREPEIEQLLEELRARAPGVAATWNPKKDSNHVWLELVLASRDEALLDAAACWLAERLPGQPTV